MMKRTWLLILVVLATGTLFAQEDLRVAAPVLAPIPCPYPYSRTFTNGPQPTPIATEFRPNMQAGIVGSVWNQTVRDKHFGHTFTFPNQRECCLISKGTLSVTIKALQTAPKNGAGSANDAVHVLANGAIVHSAQPWLATGVTVGTPGATTTVTVQLTAAQLANGKISFYVQDDSAVVAAKLFVSGCCIRKF